MTASNQRKNTVKYFCSIFYSICSQWVVLLQNMEQGKYVVPEKRRFLKTFFKNWLEVKSLVDYICQLKPTHFLVIQVGPF